MPLDSAGAGRAAALLGYPVGSTDAGPADLRWAAGLLHDLVVWGLDRDVPDDAVRPVEQRLGRIAAELCQSDPTLGVLLDWWLAAVVGLRPQRLWDIHPLPDDLAKAILPGEAPPNLGAEVKRRRFDEDLTRLFQLATTVPTLSQVSKAQGVVREFNIELKPVLAVLDTRAKPDADTGRRLADRVETLLRTSGVGEGTPLHTKLKREMEDRAQLAADLSARAGEHGEAVESLPATKVKGLTRLAKTTDQVLAGRLLAALGGPPPRPEPSGLAVALAEAVDGLEEDDRFRAYRMLGGLADHVARSTPSALHEVPGDWAKGLAEFVESGRRLDGEIAAALADLEPYASGDARELPALIRRALENGELGDARGWLADLSTAAGTERSRREATKALDRARNRGVTGELVDELAGAVARDDVEAMAVLANQVRVLPGMDRRLTALAGAAAPAEVARAGSITTGPVSRQVPVGVGAAPDLAVVTTRAGGSTTVSGAGGGTAVTLATPIARGWPEALAQAPFVKPTPGYVIRVNAHNRFFDGRICSAPAGNKSCASSERFKLDFCEKGIARCNWLSAFAVQPRVELTEPFVEEYQPVIDESPPDAGDVAVLWAQTEGGNEPIGLWRVLTIAPARRGWVLNGDRDAAVILPRGVVPWSAIYRRWSSPRGTQALRVMDQTGLEGLLIEVRDALASLAAEDPGTQRDVAALEVMLADQRARVPAPPAEVDPSTTAAPSPALAASGRRTAPTPAENGAGKPAAGPAKGRTKKAVEAVPAPTPAAPAEPTLQERLRARGGFYSPALVSQYELALAESRLVVLAGPSGTGKTRLAGEAAGELDAKFCLIAVRPDWHANEDLLGYLPPFPGARFSSTPASEFIRAAADELQAAQAESRTAKQFHLCLDEMNLARPEHYMAELLSKMEVIDGQIAFHTGDPDAAFPAQVPYPANLVVIGTVNLDETTLPISAKILDRSAYLHVEAGELWAFLEARPETAQVPAWIPRLLVDLDGSLDDAGQGLGYRVAERLLRWAVMGAERGHAPGEALDWGLAAQVIPRLRFTRSDPAHLEVLEAVVGRLRGAEGNFPRSVSQLERMLTELRRQDFTLGQMRLS